MQSYRDRKQISDYPEQKVREGNDFKQIKHNFWGDGSVLEPKRITVAQPWLCTKCHSGVHFKMVNG